MKKGLYLIGIGTLDRPKLLSNLLYSLRQLIVPSEIELRILVVDNSLTENARETVVAFSGSVIWEIIYLSEKERGIVSVRNRIMKYALTIDAQFLFCLDDDMTVTSSWLIELTKAQADFQADAVAGRVNYLLPETAPKWLYKKDFYGSYSRITGAEQLTARTSNFMISLDFIREYSLRFHPKLNLTGGEDTHFFHEFVNVGGKIVWCDEAVLIEEVPVSRANEEWILQRAFKLGYTRFKRSAIDKGFVRASILNLAYAFIQWIQFTAISPLFFFMAKEKRVFWVRKYKKAQGVIYAICGKSFQEYAQIHGY